ncbi:MAG: T9SS type A sorting domain-containing protein [Balneolaceae bacterium]|nr:T9SS type A sorting domain-containing protein [Balneolaceae bacterium]
MVTGGFANNGSELIFDGAGMNNENGDPTVRNIIFRGNKAFLDGGGMNNQNSSPVLTNIIFRDNTSNSSGAGIYNDNSSPSLRNVSFINNIALINGGGMYNFEESSVTLTNALFAENSASQGGGGIYVDRNSSAEITNATFANNETDGGGGGIRTRENSTTEISNSIIWGNNASQPGNEISSNGSLTLEYSLYGNFDDEIDIEDDISGTGDRTITNSITDDPLYADPDNRDYSLQELSPAINKASNQLYTDAGGDVDNDTDLADNSRVFNGETEIIDMGAYEFQGDPGAIQFTKSFDDPVAVGNTVTLEFTITNNTSESLANLNFTDDLDALLPGLEASGLPKNDVCGAGSQISGTSTLTLTGGNTSSESTCTFDVTLQLPNNARLGNYTSTTSALSSGNSTIADPATDELTISTPLSGNDNRVLAGNQNGYTFTPDDFSQTDNNLFVHVEDLPEEGSLELDGNVVSDGQDILVGDIDNEDLVWTPDDNTAYGIDYDKFDFNIKDSSDNESEDTYTLTINLAAATVELTGSEGWRFMTSPSDGETFSSFLDPISVETASAAFPTLYQLDQDEYEWNAVGNMNSEIDPGKGFIVLVEDELPTTLSSGESWEELDGSFNYSGLDYNGDDSSANPGNFYLLANPHPIALNFCEFTDAEIATSLYFWNPNAGAGFGDYVNVSCDLEEGEVLISPFQAFWIRTTASNPSLGIPEDAYEESTEPGYFKYQQKAVAQKASTSSLETSEQSTSKSSEKSGIVNNEFAIGLTVQDEEQKFSNSTHIFFSAEATPGLDPIDAPKLSAAGLAEHWVSLHSLDQKGNKYALQSRPPVDESAMSESTQTDQQAKTTIPIGVQTTENRSFTLSWNLPDQHVFDGQYFLKDTRTNDVIDLNQTDRYTFEIEPVQIAKDTHPMSEVAEIGSMGLHTHRMNAGATPRFELLVAASGVDGRTELGDVPDDFTLNQNYPNPFNPTTVISYELPQSAEVRLDVYDMVGRHIATLVNEQTSAGRHTVNFDASQLSSGVYLYRLQAGSTIMTKKLTIVK